MAVEGSPTSMHQTTAQSQLGNLRSGTLRRLEKIRCTLGCVLTPEGTDAAQVKHDSPAIDLCDESA